MEETVEARHADEEWKLRAIYKVRGIIRAKQIRPDLVRAMTHKVDNRDPLVHTVCTRYLFMS